MSFEESVPEGTHPADMLISSWPTPGTSLAIDISVIHPLGLSHQPHLVARSDAYLEQAERVKNNAYASACGRVGWHFAPVIFSTFGKVGPKGRETISKIFNFYTSALATEQEREKALWQLHQQQQVAMKKAVARMLQIGVGLLNTSLSEDSLTMPPPSTTTINITTSSVLAIHAQSDMEFDPPAMLTAGIELSHNTVPMEDSPGHLV